MLSFIRQNPTMSFYYHPSHCYSAFSFQLDVFAILANIIMPLGDYCWWGICLAVIL
ncbi:MAG: hypothetical protein NZ901_00790 [Geminocystis sp.]|nr:hypothetical protein [Geminocystis sp.]HIK37551.1 hypothetical protein [Geminocystis sp. M7585_C2015_104]MCS7146705.1 hypothetical protein [Geminocystis sp.]MCX8077145.1 hypothetical protein [Geminocystis sp.]MDW8115531.1 hypothetical protein [Geminocystis sp.]